MKRTMTAVISVWLALLVAGCSLWSQGPSSASGTDEEGSGPLYVWVAGASSSVEIFDDFTSETGIRVKAEFDTQEAWFQKVLAQKGNPEADLFWSDNAIDLSVLAGLGAFEAYASPLASSLPGYARDRDGLWYGLTARQIALVYDVRALAQDVPVTVEQWLDMNGQGPLTVPRLSSRVWDRLVIDMVVHEDEMSLLSFFEKLDELPLTYSDSAEEDVRRVAGGAIPLLLTTSENALKFMAENEKESQNMRVQPLGSKYTEQLHLITGIGMLRGTEKKETAGQLIDFLLEKKRRETLAEQLFHLPLTDDASGERLHPDEMVRLLPLIERHWSHRSNEQS